MSKKADTGFAEDMERDAFERWWASTHQYRPSHSTEPGYTHEYENPSANSAWRGWFARAIFSQTNGHRGGET